MYHDRFSSQFLSVYTCHGLKVTAEFLSIKNATAAASDIQTSSQIRSGTSEKSSYEAMVRAYRSRGLGF